MRARKLHGKVRIYGDSDPTPYGIRIYDHLWFREDLGEQTRIRELHVPSSILLGTFRSVIFYIVDDEASGSAFLYAARTQFGDTVALPALYEFLQTNRWGSRRKADVADVMRSAARLLEEDGLVDAAEETPETADTMPESSAVRP